MQCELYEVRVRRKPFGDRGICNVIGGELGEVVEDSWQRGSPRGPKADLFQTLLLEES